ncbi:MAG: sn-glycerol-3-phosphate ABC transporter ATP-binding protein UgpC [Gammaproteobacteria bacterium]|jgi:multiple sugar transport system ATP-binding protein|nr:sn-glycerol-3-phosphate ABC transporter ATP-binding protein UgpC [Gammaproteobacteria bacterium]
MGAITIQELTKSYGETNVLKGIDLAIDDGEFLILVGPSGCGKSTLMNCIAGLEDITSGELFIGDDNVTSVNPKDRDIAMVFQSYALYPTMTVERNIRFGLEMRKYPKDEIESTVKDVAKLLQIEHLLDRKPSQLSGGQRQRVAMGRALARSPRVFLFDEPLSNLDAKLRVEMRTEIKKLHKRLGTTIVYVTHDQVEAMTLADRIAVMKDGIVQQFGTPYEIYNDPANRFVADFMGSPAMNFVECIVFEGNLIVESGNQRHEVVIPNTQAVIDSGLETVILGLRPEMITEPKPHAESGYITQMQLGVQVTEPTGPDTLAFGEWNGQEIQARLSPEVGAQAEIDGEVQIQVDTGKAVLFHPQTGARI